MGAGRKRWKPDLRKPFNFYGARIVGGGERGTVAIPYNGRRVQKADRQGNLDLAMKKVSLEAVSVQQVGEGLDFAFRETVAHPYPLHTYYRLVSWSWVVFRLSFLLVRAGEGKWKDLSRDKDVRIRTPLSLSKTSFRMTAEDRRLKFPSRKKVGKAKSSGGGQGFLRACYIS